MESFKNKNEINILKLQKIKLSKNEYLNFRMQINNYIDKIFFENILSKCLKYCIKMNEEAEELKGKKRRN